MSFESSRWARRIGFGSFYFVQGLPWGYVSFALSSRLAGLGKGAGVISWLMSAAGLPWTIKPLAGALVDAYGAHPLGGRRFYILAAQALLLPALLVLAVVDALPALAATLLAIGLLCSLQDVAGDALAVRLVPASERAEINGVMHAAKYGGGLVGGALAGWLMERVFPAAGPLLMALGVGAALLFLVRVPETGRQACPGLSSALRLPRRSGDVRIGRELAGVLRSGGWLPFILAFAAKIGFGVQAPILPSLLTGRQGLPAATFAVISGGLGLVASAAGALVGGRVADKRGRKKVAAVAGVACAFLTLVVALNVDLVSSARGAALFYVASGFTSGVYVASLLGILMGLARTSVAATHFSLFAATINLGLIAGKASGGPLAEAVGHEGGLMVAAAMAILAPVLVGLVQERVE